MIRHLYLLALTLLLARTMVVAQTANQTTDALARSVTIHRDTIGVPHIFGKTDASVRSE